jgi:hypothetical protein
MVHRESHRAGSFRVHCITDVVGCMLTAALILIPSARAQYTYDPAAADEQIPGIRYFGSAKDDNGSLMPGVTILLDGGQSSFIFVTDEQGRFHGTLPLDAVASRISPKCWKSGFEFLRATKRPGPEAPKPTVQVDCVLRPAKSG